MRRLFTVVLLTAIILFSLAFGASAARTSVARICTQKAQGPSSVVALIKCVTTHLYVPGGTSKALYIAYRESHYQPWVHNPRSSACGVYQFVTGTWNSVVRTYLYGHALGSIYCENGRMNTFLALRYAHYHGWGPWGG